MGNIIGRWCFTGWGEKAKTRRPYCADAAVDTGASVPVIPEREAKRLGVLLRDVAPELTPKLPLDAQGKRVPGDFYLLGNMTSTTHGCEIDPVMVFGQPGQWRTRRPRIGREPLQTARAQINYGPDEMTCRRVIRAAQSVGAKADLRYTIKKLIPKGPVEV